MTRSTHTAKLNLDFEIERTFHILRRSTKHITTEEASLSRFTESPSRFNTVIKLSWENEPEPEEIMVNTTNKSLKELATPDLNHQPLCIDYPDLDVSFELRSRMIHLLLTFHGLIGEDPHKHLKEFHVVCSNMKPQGIFEEQIKLRALPFSLADLAKDWLYYLPSGSITSWNELKRLFLEKYFLASWATTIRKKICGIRQDVEETLYEY